MWSFLSILSAFWLFHRFLLIVTTFRLSLQFFASGMPNLGCNLKIAKSKWKGDILLPFYCYCIILTVGDLAYWIICSKGFTIFFI